jgi:hypothetical protein
MRRMAVFVCRPCSRGAQPRCASLYGAAETVRAAQPAAQHGLPAASRHQQQRRQRWWRTRWRTSGARQQPSGSPACCAGGTAARTARPASGCWEHRSGQRWQSRSHAERCSAPAAAHPRSADPLLAGAQFVRVMLRLIHALYAQHMRGHHRHTCTAEPQHLTSVGG